jgi:hypothetical protein
MEAFYDFNNFQLEGGDRKNHPGGIACDYPGGPAEKNFDHRSGF